MILLDRIFSLYFGGHDQEKTFVYNVLSKVREFVASQKNSEFLFNISEVEGREFRSLSCCQFKLEKSWDNKDFFLKDIKPFKVCFPTLNSSK